MVVSFPFTFSFSVPGLPNPFSYDYAKLSGSTNQNPSEPVVSEGGDVQNTGFDPLTLARDRITSKSPVPSFSSTNSSSRPPQKTLKRGWEPAFAETSQSTTTLVSTSGYLDPPSRHRAQTMHDQPDEELPPPSKRRRGLAGSIVSTAVNAALIGTAVGLTVYRIWRGRGKEQERLAIEAADADKPDSESAQQSPPPPPYQEREWTTVSYPTPPESSSAPLPPPQLLSSTTPRRKVVRPGHHNARRPRRTHVSRPQTAPSPGRAGPSTQPENSFGRDGEEQSGDDQMDWIGDKLAQLIEEGKRALSREVVVMSDAKEDEVDDGSGAWEEEDNHALTTSTSLGRTSSLRRGMKRSRAHFYGAGNSSSHSISSVSGIPPPLTPRRTHVKAFSADAFRSREDEAWESPELRETMQRARERLLVARGTS